tara:strand:+ start:398 stop:661 length:264 start_codon:yes stop_codon:yes gene_type:complete
MREIKLIDQLKRNAKYEFFYDYLNLIEISDDMVLKEMWQNVNLIDDCTTIQELKNIKFVEKELNGTFSWDAIEDHKNNNLFVKEEIK